MKVGDRITDPIDGVVVDQIFVIKHDDGEYTAFGNDYKMSAYGTGDSHLKAVVLCAVDINNFRNEKQTKPDNQRKQKEDNV